jgi:poly(3-hydroxyalkanoate) synthetase
MLLTYGFVLKPYVLDLVPGNSLVEYLVGQGFDVYMLDLGNSDAARLSLGDLIFDYVHGQVLETLGAGDISLFGQVQSGTLWAMYASLFPRGPLEISDIECAVVNISGKRDYVVPASKTESEGKGCSRKPDPDNVASAFSVRLPGNLLLESVLGTACP